MVMAIITLITAVLPMILRRVWASKAEKKKIAKRIEVEVSQFRLYVAEMRIHLDQFKADRKALKDKFRGK